jgi:hypothetical protein
LVLYTKYLSRNTHTTCGAIEAVVLLLLCVCVCMCVCVCANTQTNTDHRGSRARCGSRWCRRASTAAVWREREREREREGWGSLVIYLAHLKRERERAHTYTHITHQSANLTQTCITHQGHTDRHDWHQDVIHHR